MTSTEQTKVVQSLLTALDNIKIYLDEVPSSKTKSNKPKRPLNPKIVALNAERKLVYQEMKDKYFTENPSAQGKSVEQVRKLAKEKKLPPFPTYPMALVEHSKRMGDKDPEHARKSRARRVNLDNLQASKKLERYDYLNRPEEKKIFPPDSRWTIAYSTSDPEEFNMNLFYGKEKFLMNGLYWVLTPEQDWVGVFNPETRVLDRSAPEPGQD